jgi:hypothetical protein
MTVSGAGEGVPAEGAPEGAEAAPEQAPALSPEISERFERMESLIEDALGHEPEGEPEQQQPEQEQRYLLDPATGRIFDRLSQQFVPDDLAEQMLGPEEMSPEQMQRHIDEQVSARVAEAMQPYAQQQQAQELAALEEAYPDMRDAKVATAVVEEAQKLASQTRDPEAWRSAAFLENVYLARQARERAEQEVPASGQAPTHEQPGAVPADAEAEDYGDRIVAARPGGGFWM